jgi:hypothetical protein
VYQWDANIYTEKKEHTLGNLILLPTDINSLVENKDWAVKYLHYCHVGVAAQEKIQELSTKAKAKGIVLSAKAVKYLAAAKFNCAVQPVLQLGEANKWDAGLIDRRTRQIKEITWDTMSSWLN